MPIEPVRAVSDSVRRYLNVDEMSYPDEIKKLAERKSLSTSTCSARRNEKWLFAFTRLILVLAMSVWHIILVYAQQHEFNNNSYNRPNFTYLCGRGGVGQSRVQRAESRCSCGVWRSVRPQNRETDGIVGDLARMW